MKRLLIFLAVITLLSTPVNANTNTHFSSDTYSEEVGDVVTMDLTLSNKYNHSDIHISIAGENSTYRTTTRVRNISRNNLKINFITGKVNRKNPIDIVPVDSAKVELLREKNSTDLQPGSYEVSVFSNGKVIATSELNLKKNKVGEIEVASVTENSNTTYVEGVNYHSVAYGDTAVIIFNIEGLESFFYERSLPIENIDIFNQRSEYEIRVVDPSTYYGKERRVRLYQAEMYYKNDKVYLHIPTSVMQNSNKKNKYEARVINGLKTESNTTFSVERKWLIFQNKTDGNIIVNRGDSKQIGIKTNRAVGAYIEIKILNEGILRDVKNTTINKLRRGTITIDTEEYKSEHFLTLQPRRYKNNTIIYIRNQSIDKQTTTTPTQTTSPTTPSKNKTTPSKNKTTPSKNKTTPSKNKTVRPTPTTNNMTNKSTSTQTLNRNKTTNSTGSIPRVTLPEPSLISGIGSVIALLSFLILGFRRL